MFSLPLSPVRFFVSLLLLAFLQVPGFASDSIVVFNELQYHPTDVGEAAEWVELHNQNGVNVDMSGWKLADGIDYTFPNGTVILGKGFLVIAKTPASVPGSIGPFIGSLKNSGERVALLDNNNRVMDEVTYADSGDWPIAPDGSGVTLVKRNGWLGSNEAENWTSSTQLGGTPGARNFAPPPTGLNTVAIPLSSTWKYNTSGSDLGTAWTAPAYNDASWSSGVSSFSYGGGSMYEDPPVSTSAQGYWSMLRWTGDADSGISTTKTYTHKVDLNHSGTATVINGVTLDNGALSGSNWALLSTTSTYTTNTTAPRNPMVSTSGSYQLLKDFYYAGAATTTDPTKLQLTGLTPGNYYTLTLYATGWDAREIRRVQITPDNTGVPTIFDEGAGGMGATFELKYTYKAPTSGSLTLSFLVLTAATSWHQYGFTNEQDTAYPLEAAIATVPAVTEFSSQLAAPYVTGSSFTRQAVNSVNSSGLNSFGDHGISPDGNMWLSTGNFAAPNDLLPALITYDLGAATELTALRVWNYNEYSGTTDNTTRGCKDVEILTSPDASGETFTSRGSYVFTRAYGCTSEIGQRVGFASALPNVRRVRLNITTNHGDANQFAGLAEVKFYQTYVAPPPTPVPAKETITSLYNTGVTNTGSPAVYGTTDLHWTAAAGSPVATPIVSSPHSAWMQADGVSNFIGFTATGTDNVAFGQFTFSTSFDLTNFVPGSEDIKFYVAVDNVLDYLKLNGGASRLYGLAGFTSYLGPYPITGPFNTGTNTLDFAWTNSGTAVGPGALRMKFDARAQPKPRTSLAANPVTSYFRQKFTLTGALDSHYSLVLQHALDDGAVFYLNGQELYRTNMPLGAVSASTLATADLPYPRTSARLSLPGTLIHPGENTLAVELHQASVANVDAYFAALLEVQETPSPLGSLPAVQLNEVASATASTSPAFIELRNNTAFAITLTGYTLVSSGGGTFDLGGVTIAATGLVSINSATYGFSAVDGAKIFLKGPGSPAVLDAVEVKQKAQARNGAGWATPNAATPNAANTFSISDAIVINEIMYKHAPIYGATGKTDVPEEWIELYNKSGAAVDLSNWAIKGGISYTFPASTSLAVGGYLVVAKDKPALALKYPSITIAGNFSGSLSSEDSIRVEDANSNTVDSVHYYGGGHWDDRANGGGSSLELRDPNADNTRPEAWMASDESGKAVWQNYEYNGLGAPTILNGTSAVEPATYNEFCMGLLAEGEYLIDDIFVTEDPNGTPIECIQNGGFEGLTDTSFWRLLGTHGSHGQSVVVPDPADAAKKVLKVHASDGTEHMHNHCETTLKNGASFVILSATKTYRIKFRARWVSGSPRLQTRLYFNRLARQFVLPIPQNTGTPGAQNSRYVANAGPTFSSLSHFPITPPDGQPVTVSIVVSDPNNVASVNLKYRKDGTVPYSSLPMTASNGFYAADLPAQVTGTLVEFYVEAADGLGAVSTYPATSATAGALVKWYDGYAATTPGHEFRILMTAANTNFMHLNTNCMSNDFLPATVIYQGSEVFYDAKCRLKSSERGRNDALRTGFAVSFDEAHQFRGVNTTINLDRSGIGRAAIGQYGHGEIANWQYINHAGGVPGMYNDLIYLISPRPDQVGSAMLTMAEYNDNYLAGQFENGSDGPVFKLEFIYYPTSTSTGGPEGLKIATPDAVSGVSFSMQNSPADKEAYRWTFLLGNASGTDDYSRLINFNQVMRMADGAAFNTAIASAIDVNEWLRASAAMCLCGAVDHYSSSGSGTAHNMKVYARPSDGRILYMPWDADYETAATNAAVIGNSDLQKIMNANPAYVRAFYGHLQDIITRSFNQTYLQTWTNHYTTYSTTGGNWADIITFVNARAAFVLGTSGTPDAASLAAKFPGTTPFQITTNGGNDFSDPGPLVTLAGTAGVDVETLRLSGSATPLAVTWTSTTAWQVSVPISAGPTLITIEAISYNKTTVVNDSITITGTGSIVPASLDNLVISELHYHPSTPTAAEATAGYPNIDDFEFIELQNISSNTLILTGCQFDIGITYSFVAGTQIAPGGRVVLPRRGAAFALRHPGVATVGEYYVATDPTGNQFSNGGEAVRLMGANGQVIKSFTYDDEAPWPTSPDGPGNTLTLIAPSTNPDHNDPHSWRASMVVEGSPGTSDSTAWPANPLADHGDGYSNLANYALASGTRPEMDVANNTFSFVRNLQADARATVQISDALSGWTNVPDSTLTFTAIDGTTERVTLSLAPGTIRKFVRLFVLGR